MGAREPGTCPARDASNAVSSSHIDPSQRFRWISPMARHRRGRPVFPDNRRDLDRAHEMVGANEGGRLWGLVCRRDRRGHQRRRFLSTTASCPSPSATASPKPTVTPSAKPSPVPVQTTVRFLNAPLTVPRGAYGTLKVKTSPKTLCTIEVDYKSGPSKAAGLGAKTSDSAGNVSWTWKVGATTTRGSWPITVICGDASAQTYIKVT